MSASMLPDEHAPAEPVPHQTPDEAHEARADDADGNIRIDAHDRDATDDDDIDEVDGNKADRPPDANANANARGPRPRGRRRLRLDDRPGRAGLQLPP